MAAYSNGVVCGGDGRCAPDKCRAADQGSQRAAIAKFHRASRERGRDAHVELQCVAVGRAAAGAHVAGQRRCGRKRSLDDEFHIRARHLDDGAVTRRQSLSAHRAAQGRRAGDRAAGLSDDYIRSRTKRRCAVVHHGDAAIDRQRTGRDVERGMSCVASETCRSEIRRDRAGTEINRRSAPNFGGVSSNRRSRAVADEGCARAVRVGNLRGDIERRPRRDAHTGSGRQRTSRAQSERAIAYRRQSVISVGCIEREDVVANFGEFAARPADDSAEDRVHRLRTDAESVRAEGEGVRTLQRADVVGVVARENERHLL